MSNYLLRTTRLGCLVLSTLFSLPGLTQQRAPVMPLEDVGVIRAVDASRSMITVGQRTLRITSATKITAEDPALRYSSVSQAWLGHQIGMETDRGTDGIETISRLHFFQQSR